MSNKPFDKEKSYLQSISTLEQPGAIEALIEMHYKNIKLRFFNYFSVNQLEHYRHSGILHQPILKNI